MGLFQASVSKHQKAYNITGRDIVIIFVGDSIMKAGPEYQDQYYPNRIKDRLDPICNSVEFRSYGYYGKTTKQIIDSFRSNISTHVDPTKLNIVVGHEDVNAILNAGVTAQENYDDWELYYQMCKNVGVDLCVHVSGFHPRTPYNLPIWEDGTPQTRLEIQRDHFDLVVDNPISTADITVDLRQNSVLGGSHSQHLDPTYFIDSVHLKDTGLDALAAQVWDEGIAKLVNIN